MHMYLICYYTSIHYFITLQTVFLKCYCITDTIFDVLVVCVCGTVLYLRVILVLCCLHCTSVSFFVCMFSVILD
jgi:hypothetical protein